MANRGTLTLRREDGRVVCESVEVADTTLRRLRGLLGRRSLRTTEGLVLRPAWSVHTAFMRFPIDVVFLDHDQVVVRIEPQLRSFKTATCRGAREVVELPAGECARRGLQPGDRVAWAARSSFDEAVAEEGPVPRVERRGSVVVASRDQRFAKLLHFLLEGRGIGVTATVPPDEVVDALEDGPDVVVLDASSRLAETLRLANAARARRPETAFVLVGEGAAQRGPSEIRVFDKWNETDEAVSAVEEAIGSSAGRSESPLEIPALDL